MSFLSRIFYGVDLDAEQARADEADAQLAALNKQALERGVYGPELYAQAEQNRQASQLNVGEDVEGQFWEGWQEGRDRVLQPVESGLGAVAKAIWKTIPWWGWVMLLAGAFIYLGGLPWLKGKLKQ